MLKIIMTNYGLIPLPGKIADSREICFFDNNWTLNYAAALDNESVILQQDIQDICDWKITSDQGLHKISLILDKAVSVSSAEGYLLNINPNEIIITAGTRTGIFYGCKTLYQLIFSCYQNNLPVLLPCLQIEDEPRFQWRGSHLDVARHFFPVDVIKEHINLLAHYKINYFHMHLTDDQGWRVEIKKYPKLTAIGSSRSGSQLPEKENGKIVFDNKPLTGYYTQKQLRDIVSYAQDRHITIVPEIDMPGHMQAAIAAYPELGNTAHKIEVGREWGISKNILNPSANTVKFMQDILSEIIELFPGKFIHLGGDEAPKDQWKESAMAQKIMQENNCNNEEELQSYFMRQMNNFLKKHNRQLIGWDEILEGRISPDVIIMSWRDNNSCQEAVQAQHSVIMAPANYTYFDFHQDPDFNPPENEWLKVTTLKKVYAFEPVPSSLTDIEKSFILGTQGQVWTEQIPNIKKLHEQTWPRMCALAEVAWSDKNIRNWDNFKERMRIQIKHLQKQNIYFYNGKWE